MDYNEKNKLISDIEIELSEVTKMLNGSRSLKNIVFGGKYTVNQRDDSIAILYSTRSSRKNGGTLIVGEIRVCEEKDKNLSLYGSIDCDFRRALNPIKEIWHKTTHKYNVPSLFQPYNQ